MEEIDLNREKNSFSARRRRHLLAKKKKSAKKRGISIDSPSMGDLTILFDNYQKGRFNIAIKLGFSITENFPNHPYAWNILGASLLNVGRADEALHVNQKLVDICPKDPNYISNLATSYKGIGRLNEAESSYKKAISLGQNNPVVHNNLATTLTQLHNYAEAEVHYKKAISLKYDYSEAHHNFASMLSDQGRLNEARLSYETAIKLNPTNAATYRMYSQIKDFKSKDEQYLRMQDLYLDQNISDNQRCEISFALGKACEDLQDYKQAFQFFSEGNRLRKIFSCYDIGQDLELFREIKSSFSEIAGRKLEIDQQTNGLKPIFIIGMPRSGTTLVEQIIACHSSVTGAGELTFVSDFGSSIARGLSECSKCQLLSFRQKYIKSVKKVSGGKLIVTDKMPQNFLYLGLISAAFPEAKIVHVKRRPAATCWANYKNFFATIGLGYSNDLEDICSYYYLYEELMEFWSQALGNRIYNLDYELLTENQDNETRSLIKYLDLEWEDKCLKPQDNIRAVHTSSSSQVRKSVYQGSSQRWEKFKPFLNGIFDHF